MITNLTRIRPCPFRMYYFGGLTNTLKREGVFMPKWRLSTVLYSSLGRRIRSYVLWELEDQYHPVSLCRLIKVFTCGLLLFVIFNVTPNTRIVIFSVRISRYVDRFTYAKAFSSETLLNRWTTLFMTVFYNISALAKNILTGFYSQTRHISFQILPAH